MRGRIKSFYFNFIIILAAAVMAMCVMNPIAYSQDVVKNDKEVVSKDDVKKALDDALSEKAKTEFLGVNWGMSIGLTIGNDKDQRVEEAIIDSVGLVRVTKGVRSFPRIMLETHYFAEVSCWGICRSFGVGPFVAVQPGSAQAIAALGGGILFGLQRGDKKSSFNLGIGWIVDNGIKTLAGGFTNNEYPEECRRNKADKESYKPGCGEITKIRYQEQTQDNWMILASFSF